MRLPIILSNEDNFLSITRIADKRIINHMILWIRVEVCTHLNRKFIWDVCALLIFQQRKFVAIYQFSLFHTLPIIEKHRHKLFFHKGNANRGFQITIIKLLTENNIVTYLTSVVEMRLSVALDIFLIVSLWKLNINYRL